MGEIGGSMIRWALRNRHGLVDLNDFDSEESALAFANSRHSNWREDGMTIISFEEGETGMTPQQKQISEDIKGKTVDSLKWEDDSGGYWVMRFKGGGEICFRFMAEVIAREREIRLELLG